MLIKVLNKIIETKDIVCISDPIIDYTQTLAATDIYLKSHVIHLKIYTYNLFKSANVTYSPIEKQQLLLDEANKIIEYITQHIQSEIPEYELTKFENKIEYKI